MKRIDTININSISNILLSVSILLTVIIQFFIGTVTYDVLRQILYFFLGLILIFTLPKIKIKRNSFIATYFFLIFFSVLFSFLVSIFTSTLNFEYVNEITAAYLILLIGYFSKISEKVYITILNIYISLIIILGFFLIFYYGSGFLITDTYFFGSKNQVAPIIYGAAIVSFFMLLNNVKTKGNFHINKTSVSTKSIYLIFFSLLIIFGIILRNRAGLVSLLIVIISYFFSDFSLKINKNSVYKGMVFIVFMIALTPFNLFGNIASIIKNVFLSSYDVTSIDSVSAGRVSVYIETLSFLKKSALFGEITLNSSITKTPHNFLLNLWLNNGFLGMLPVTILYVCLWVLCLKNIFVKKHKDFAIYLLFFILLVSLFEPTYPFSPLTSQAFMWFMLGRYLKKNDI